MNPLTPWLACAVLLALLIFVGYVAIKACRAKDNEVRRLKYELQKERTNCIYLLQHAEELAKIKDESLAVDQAINEAKTDEEILSIINTVIADNNSKLRD